MRCRQLPLSIANKEKKNPVFVLKGYEYFLGFLLACSLVPILSLTASKVLRPSGGGPERRTTYESGMEPIGGAWIQFNIRYYMFALVFVVFDVETVFLYPWAVAFNQFGPISFCRSTDLYCYPCGCSRLCLAERSLRMVITAIIFLIFDFS
jgi:NAD(P)H-quinone oxidoreductase subunit 3